MILSPVVMSTDDEISQCRLIRPGSEFGELREIVVFTAEQAP